MDVNFCPSPASGQTSRDRDDRHKRRENRHRESDREKRPRHGHEGGREGRRAHTGGERKKAPPEKEDDNKVKYIVVVVVIFLVIGGIGGLVYFVSSPDSGLACDREKTKDPVLGNECSEPACTFDVGQCPLPCPFGYTMKNSSVTCPINCNCAAQGQFQGDVQFGDEDVPDLLAMFDYVDREDEEFSLFSGSAYKLYSVGVWSVRRREDGTVPVAYTLTDKLLKDPWMMDAIDTAVKWLKESTCVRWERYDPKKHLKEHVVDIADRKSCSSVIGMRKGTVKQQMSLTVYCNWPSVVVHEMIHTLGFFHEHTRPDRDDHVIVNFDNIVKRLTYNFRKAKKMFVYDLNSPYDISSIMHYNPYVFSKNRKFTMIDRKTNTGVKTQTAGLSKQDIHEINELLCHGHKSGKLQEGRKEINYFDLATTTAGNYPWMLWTQCDKTCGPGQRSRNRLCFTQECGRKQREYEFKKCNLKNCVKVWKWTPWSKYGSCSVTCGSGMQLRHRLCLRAGKCGGGRSMEAQTCTLKNCHDNGMGVKMTWLNWGIWGACSRSCLGGVWYRYRICKKGDRLTFSCPGKFTDVGYCNSIKCSEAQNSPPSPMFAYVSTTVAHLCSSTSDASWVFGDFNGDGRDDALCKSQYGDFEVGFGTADGDISPTNWRGRLEGCGSHSGQIKVGDFNSDGASDLVCTDRIRRKITIHLSDKDKFNSEFYTGSFCTSDTDMLIVTNLDSDPRSDLLCIHSNSNHEMLINSFTI